LSLHGTGKEKSLERQKFVWNGNIKMDHKEIRWEEFDWIDQIQDRNKWQVAVNAATNICVVYSLGSFMTGQGTVDLCKKTLFVGGS
jgi:hypothetical protein